MGETWWSHSVGNIPYKVTVFEHPKRKGVAYLRWRVRTPDGPNWKNKSLGYTLRTVEGRLIKERQKQAIAEAERQHLTLVKGVAPDDRPKPLLTLGETRALLTHPHTGKYPTDTMHRREVLRTLALAEAIWGTGMPWAGIRPRHLRELWRRKLEQVRAAGRPGRRSAELVVIQIGAVAAWLRDEEYIPANACVVGKKWRAELARETEGTEPHRPRHTVAEIRQILARAHEVDPRFGLLVHLGIELRLGQVRRARRSDLDLEAGKLTVRGRGKKKGETVYLTPGQMVNVRRALNGYLRLLEATEADYYLFPAGQLAGGRSGEGVAKERHASAGPVDTSAIRTWWQEAEALCEITHLKGRGWYGGRRGSVDLAKSEGVSREVLEKFGGWSDAQIPDTIYADQEAEYARRGASEVRAKLRGEGAEESPET